MLHFIHVNNSTYTVAYNQRLSRCRNSGLFCFVNFAISFLCTSTILTMVIFCEKP